MTLRTLKKGDLTIALDEDYLLYKKNEMLDLIDSEEFEILTNKKNSPLTEDEFKVAIKRLYDLALDIIDEKLGIDIFEYIPCTKKGTFHKTNTTLLATSDIKNVFNGDYFSMEMMDLRLTPVSYSEKIDPFLALKKTGSVLGTITGEGTIAYIELDWHNRGKNEKPIFDSMNNPTKIEKVRNKYLKIETMQPGYTYFDAKGNEFFYAGRFYVEGKHHPVYKNKADYLKSDFHKNSLKLRGGTYQGEYLFLKMTKKNRELVENSKDLDELFTACIHRDFWDWETKWKFLINPLKVVSEGEKVLDATFTEGYYYEEKMFPPDTTVYDTFTYIENSSI